MINFVSVNFENKYFQEEDILLVRQLAVFARKTHSLSFVEKKKKKNQASMKMKVIDFMKTFLSFSIVNFQNG